MDTSDPIIDDDEILPEIEIRELLTIEQMQEYNNNFVAFTNNDIYILMNDLSNKNYQGFIQQYKNIINRKGLSIYDYNIIPIINAKRKNYHEDAEEIQKYFNDYEDALTARNYTLQQIRINKISFPFDIEQDQDQDFNRLKISQPGEVLLDYSKPDLSKITIFDIDYYSDIIIKHLIYKSPLWTNESYINEYNNNHKYIFNNSLSIKNLIETNELNNIYKHIKDKLIPKFDDVLKLITKKCSLHELKLILSYNSYDIDTLTKDEFNQLYDHLNSLIDNDNNEDDDKTDHKSLIKTIKIKKQYEHFYDILTYHFSKFSIITQDEKLLMVTDRLNNYISNIPPSALVLSSELSNLKILEDLSSSFDEIIVKIRSFINEENKSKIIRFMNDYKLLKVPESIDNIIDIYKKIDSEYLDSCKFLSMNIINDLSTVTIGNDTTDYDGNPNDQNVNKNVVEDAEEYIEIDNDIDENIDAVEDAIDIYQLNDIYNEDELSNLSDGVKDILIFVIPLLLKISKISGLPLNTKIIADRLSKIIVYESRANQIKKHIPDISDNLIKLICQDNFDDALRVIQDISNISIITLLQNIYPDIHKSWSKECNKIFVEAMTLWWLELLEASLRGTLIFNIFDGYIEFSNKWSRFGPPLEDKSKTGIIIYLCNVATNISDIKLNYNDIQLQTEILDCANDKYTEKITLLENLWIDVSKTIDTLSNIENIKMSLIEIIKLLKVGKKSKKMLPTYITAFLNLPRLIEQKKIKSVIWAQGCCITSLTQNYEADADWRSFGSLWSLKNILSQDKFIKKRENFVYFPFDNVETKDEIKFIKPNCFDINIDKEEKIISDIKYTWLSPSIITDANYAKTIYSDIIKNIYSIKNANLLLKIFDNIKSILDCKNILLIISKVLFKINNPIVNENNYCKEMKEYLETLSEDDITIAKYVISKALCLPGTYNTTLILPSNMPVDLYSNIKKENFKNIVSWNTSKTEMTKEEITDFLTKMREKQKDLILSNLNELEDKEKQNLNDMKKYGLIKFTELYREFGDEQNENSDIYKNIDEDAEGESDFLALPTDNDEINDDAI